MPGCFSRQTLSLPLPSRRGGCVVPPTTPTTTVGMVIQHPVVHNGPAILALVAMALLAGLAGGAVTGLLMYAKAKGTVLWP